VTNVQNWNTTIVMTPDNNPLSGNTDSFEIVIPMGAQSFSGTYTDTDGTTVYEWQGTAHAESLARNTAQAVAFAAID
jgi:hypothetical protein